MGSGWSGGDGRYVLPYSVCQKFFPLIPSPPNGERVRVRGAEKTFGNEYNPYAGPGPGLETEKEDDPKC
jgi:hypothetical protein